MARKKAKDSPWPHYGLKDLSDQEAEFIGKFLKKKRISFAYLKTFLLQKWIKQVEQGKAGDEIKFDGI
jgi:hypothetical protein